MLEPEMRLIACHSSRRPYVEDYRYLTRTSDKLRLCMTNPKSNDTLESQLEAKITRAFQLALC